MVITRYAGARGKLKPEQVARLAPSYLLQPKLDGAYALVATDERGAIASLTLRSGRVLQGPLAEDYTGLIIGAPCSTFAAEVELYTEAGNRHAVLRGYRNLYLLDCLSLDGASLAEQPYSVRYEWLQRIRATCEGQTPDRAYQDAFGRFHDNLGRFSRDIPQAHRRYSIVPQVDPSEYQACLTRWVTFEKLGPAEGLVAVDQSAKLGARKSKLKLKAVDTVDAVVSDVGTRKACLYYRGNLFTTGLPAWAKSSLKAGEVVEVAHEGFYEASMTPRFARLVRPRPDLSAECLTTD